jgi:beta-galactosidase
MYAPVGSIIQMLCDPVDTRPVILVEYLYQISNSGGGLEYFLRLSAEYPRFQGGFVWDWQDKCLVGKTTDGKEYFAYGGDFNEAFIDEGNPGFMTCNGVVLPDLRWKPVAHELKQAYCPIRFEKPSPYSWGNIETDTYRIRRVNSLHGSEADENLECIAIAHEDGIVIMEKPVEIPSLKIGEDIVIKFPFPVEKKPSCEYTITFSLRLKSEKFYAPKGYEVGSWQFLIGKTADKFIEKTIVPSNELHISESNDAWVISVGGIHTELSKKTGLLTNLSKDGNVYLKTGFEPCLSRPVTGLDAKSGWGWYGEYEKTRQLANRIVSAKMLKGTGSVLFEFDYIFENDSIPHIRGKLAYGIDDSFKITVTCQFHVDSSITVIPRAGLEFILNEGFDEIEYYGYGPIENYCDRMLSAFLALHRSTVSEQHFPFVPPSETGGHEKTRWLKIKRKGGGNIKVSSAAAFHFDARHNSVDDYLVAAHDHELIRRRETFVHIDAAHGPIGSEMAWSSLMPEHYTLGAGSYYLEFVLEIE